MTPEEKTAYEQAFKKRKVQLAAKQGKEDAEKPPPPSIMKRGLDLTRKALKESGAI